MLTRRQVVALTQKLDKIANAVQENPSSFGLSKKAAYNFCLTTDTVSDQLEELAGVEREGNTLKRDPDEPYMDTFDEAGVVDNQMDADEPYMHEYSDDTDSQIVEDNDLTPMNDGDLEVDALFDDWGDLEASGDYWDDGDDYWG